MMLLKDLLAPWFHYSGAENVDGLILDSRTVKQANVFVALQGYQVDGRQYISQAISAGAGAVIAQTDDPAQHGHVTLTDSGIPVISFFQLNRQLSALAAQYYQVHSQQLAVIGITGTNGKTSVSQIIAQLVESLGMQAAVMGTLGNGQLKHLVDSGNTTADAITVMRQLTEFEQQGCHVCAMEVSSHGLAQGRVEAVPFTTAVFTNLSRDHLDYHGDMHAYGAAKKRLFTFPHIKHGLINADDEVGLQWLKSLNQPHFQSYSLSNANANYYCSEVRYHSHGVSATLHYRVDGQLVSEPLRSGLLGEFNLVNVLAAVAALHQEGADMAELLAGLAKVKPVAGRMEQFTQQGKATVVVDYAHTPDALTQALKTLRLHCQGQLWCVFGCGGDRDKGKRPLMAQAAELGADHVMITSDNTRSEDPLLIIEDVKQGLTAPDKAYVDVDRVSAIKQVVSLAKATDVILLAGKGHETYQEVAGIKHHYDERALVAQLQGAK
ncbi:UDP-N-acetylmuramoyl-L-alanyl-D-glutamate--2,6-diaminopimelate ligase [Shewanella intestini]|uniref:UDP-N-acetylmuramyl-tripeptide synthetase n=1 Tax=Shewanella intestini TaxID=2017544 RepID=A0ABS5I560_9GAMM|nr:MULTISPECIES: UDP-N-acetylmuramoyl-L-alanyl-D-glutamate--2,6-diaminopimelate ligase [Shewanella]MBR9729051.1 UDP-N-acetylmuramoyl-L-alanyl-D-glutamate--2,6-diaminopimelate ligase [Shewanella intestini]MRG37127.1 UDP-N-acetylmuramoyl-L-alanyl-D-glutamate--2,6-diaminopimelate ligase [Shewanella sp. XMDDZSB0408]